MFSSEQEKDENFSSKYLSVNIRNVTYAFSLDYVKEIIPFVEILPVNSSDNKIQGLINLRGESIPVRSLDFVSENKEVDINETQKILILRTENEKFALLIDAVGDIFTIPENKISTFSSENIDFIQSTVLNRQTCLIIDIGKFLKHKDNFTRPRYNFPPAVNEKTKQRTMLMNIQDTFEIEKNNFENEKFIIFTLNNEVYAFNISYIKEIKKIDFNSVIKIPCIPNFICGIINFRGDYISLIDIKSFLNIESGPVCTQTDVIVAKINNLKFAIIVDCIIDITNFPISSVNSDMPTNSYIIGEIPYKGKLINLLNVEKLFSSENVNIET